MPIMTDNKRYDADALRRDMEEREKARRRAAIQSEINNWNTKLTNVNSQIDALTAEESNLVTYLGEWTTQKSLYDENKTLSEVVITNVFEGVCADKIQSELAGCISEMNLTYNNVAGLKGNVTAQIGRLRQQKSYINSRISSLSNEMKSI